MGFNGFRLKGGVPPPLGLKIGFQWVSIGKGGYPPLWGSKPGFKGVVTEFQREFNGFRLERGGVPPPSGSKTGIFNEFSKSPLNLGGSGKKEGRWVYPEKAVFECQGVELGPPSGKPKMNALYAAKRPCFLTTFFCRVFTLPFWF